MKRTLACALTLAVTTSLYTFTVLPGVFATPAFGAATRTLPVETGNIYRLPAHPAPAPPATWTVRSGQTLSSIARARYGHPNDWPLIYWANHRQIRWADQIRAGQVLRLPAWTGHVPAAPRYTSPPARHVYYTASHTTAGHASYQPAYRAAPASYAGSGIQACIIARESGGNSQVMNGSRHYGLYQFSYSTWVASGGSPGSFGNATVAEQNQVFYNAVAARGYSDWAPYDGC